MKIAFYAPLKPAGHPVPSGDRRMANLLIEALGQGGHDVETAALLRSRDGTGDGVRQVRLRDLGGRLATRLIRHYHRRAAAERPRAWLTYHLYYKAPDWIGPPVCAALNIPYLAAEASFAPKRAGGDWDMGHRAVAAAIRRADALIGLNSKDSACVLPLLATPERLTLLKPFLDTRPLAQAARERTTHRARLARDLDLPADAPWLLAVGMMRPGDKLESYRRLGAALGRLGARPWRLIVIGDGSARAEVEAALTPAGSARIRWVGEQTEDALAAFYAASDLYVWPAVNEAYGMAILEAQACGLPVLAGDVGGVPDIVADGESGLLVADGEPALFARALGGLLDSWQDGGSPLLARFRAAALARTARDHDITAAAARLDLILCAAVARRTP